ncbi:MAG: phosphoenolpyruvate carboxykinase (ATP) [Deltaproteobacteria bacterium]|nr:phosphoenolpyruvate carboxykinase (ATP) [Deltaproteobacteria bacterium]
MGFPEDLSDLLERRKASGIRVDPPRREMIRDALAGREAMATANGALATWTPVESTGRSPKDTVFVRRPESEAEIDWDSPNSNAVTPDTFDRILEDCLTTLATKSTIYVTNRVVGADSHYALPIRTVTDQALTALFTDNMFRPVPPDLERSCFARRPFTLLVLPYDKLRPERYQGRLRVDPRLGGTSTMVVGMDLDRRIGVVYGSAYGGSVKKLIFTVMNTYLPAEGILPLHCSANEGVAGDVSLLLGLSGTGKTTLSADPRRALLGDDEHGWSDRGVANFEYGCYAKLIRLDPQKEPEIHRAICHQADPLDHGAIIENAMVYPNGSLDLDDERFTPNSRASYPLSFLSNTKDPPVGDHPRTILFLAADANGVLPPVSRLGRDQAMLWFLMGYTSKLAGTETGVVDPVSTFSRFFGEPFMPRHPGVYARLLGEKLDRHHTRVYLVNTGWSGGPFGVGRRMDITLTRELVEGALSGALEDVPWREDPLFHLQVPLRCPGVSDPTILDPGATWSDRSAFETRARRLASEFSARFDKAYGHKGIDPAVVACCPGK